jgi:uncharacterized protein (TIGR02118 family)
MIKVLAPANRHPAHRSLADFHRYWAESHGPLFANTGYLRRYVQHLSLPESYDGEPRSNLDGASMFWYDDLDALRHPSQSPEAVALREAVRSDDQQLFDREMDTWPLHHKRASVTATERVIIDGDTEPSMVKAIFIASRLPGLTHDEFFTHWAEVHGALGARLPGLRRYVQNHAILEAYTVRPMTHDGWAELWFDDLEALRSAYVSPQWEALREDGRTLFAQPMGVVIARERIQKWEGIAPVPLDTSGWTEASVRERLARDGYDALATDPDGPSRILTAGRAGLLAVWTEEHLVTIDASRIDARPEAKQSELRAAAVARI